MNNNDSSARQLPLFAGVAPDVHNSRVVSCNKVAEYFERVYCNDVDSLRIAERLLQNLPPQLIKAGSEILNKNETLLLYPMLTVVNAVREQNVVDKYFQAYDKRYNLHQLRVGRRIQQVNGDEEKTFRGIFADCPIPSSVYPVLNCMTEEQLYLWENIAFAVNQSRTTIPNEFVVLLNTFEQMYQADTVYCDPYLNVFSSPVLRPMLVGVFWKWRRGHLANVLVGKLRQSFGALARESLDIDSLPLDFISSALYTTYVQNLCSSKVPPAGSEIKDVDWRVAAYAGNLVERVLSLAITNSQEIKHVRDIKLIQFFATPSVRSRFEAAVLSRSPLEHFKENGFAGDITVRAAHAMACLLLNRNSGIPLEGSESSQDMILLDELLPQVTQVKSQKSIGMLSTLVGEFESIDYLRALLNDVRKNGESVGAVHTKVELEEQIARNLITHNFPSVVRFSYLLATLSRIITNAAQPVTLQEGQQLFSQVYLTQESMAEGGKYGKIDLIVVNDDVASSLEIEGHLLTDIFSAGNTPQTIALLGEVKSNGSLYKVPKFAPRTIQREHYEQVVGYMRVLRTNYPNIQVNKAVVIYVDPIRTTVLPLIPA